MTSGARSRPTWQTDECPPWCVTDHRESDPPEDRFHDSATHYVPVTLGIKDSDQLTPAITPAELFLTTSRPCGEHDDWTFVGEPARHGQHLMLSKESARRLAEALLEHLDTLT